MAFSSSGDNRTTGATPAPRGREAYVTASTLDARLAAWIAHLAGSPGRAPLPPLDDAALLLVDCQRLFLDPSSPAFLPSWPAVKERCKVLLEIFRAERRPVIWTRHVDAGEVSAVIGHFGGRTLAKDDPITYLAKGWTPRAGETQIPKSRYSAWAMTRLRHIIDPRAVVILAGVTTHRCILATAVEAASHDRICVVAADACATANERLHLDALSVIANGFAHVASVREIEDAVVGGG